MNTLKLKLLAASMFACATAFAQGNPAPSLGTAPSANANAAGYRTRTASFANDSYVLQDGRSQYGIVDQTGPGNTADLYQVGGADNNAVQQQIHQGSAGRNVAYAQQGGSRSTSLQGQLGSGNTARMEQGLNGADDNFGYQVQIGNNNRAGVSQTSDRNVAVQIQAGDRNYATTAQSNLSSWSYTEQYGNNNAAIVTQH